MYQQDNKNQVKFVFYFLKEQDEIFCFVFIFCIFNCLYQFSLYPIVFSIYALTRFLTTISNETDKFIIFFRKSILIMHDNKKNRF